MPVISKPPLDRAVSMAAPIARCASLLLVVATVAGAACGGGGTPELDASELDALLGDADGGPPGDASSPTCAEATQHSDLTWIQDRIFSPSCAGFADCHRGATPPAGLSLEPGRARANLVGVASVLFPSYRRVVPGDPQHSYLLVILGHVAGPLDPSIGTMPYGSPLLCVEKRQAIERWIAAGAGP